MKRRSFVRTLVIGSGALVVKDYDVAAAETSPDTIVVKMIYNNTGSNSDYRKEWGLALWIEGDGQAILFDTGGNPETLLQNIDAAGLDLAALSTIIISHNHWDHTRGLPAVLNRLARPATLFVPATDPPDISITGNLLTVVPVSGPRQINSFLWSTGEMEGKAGLDSIYEQSIILLRGDKLYLFTGCAHPGVVAITEKAHALNPGKEIALVAGGFHLLEHTAEQLHDVAVQLENLGLKQIAPSHCTGDKAIAWLRSYFGDRFVDFHIGGLLNL